MISNFCPMATLWKSWLIYILLGDPNDYISAKKKCNVSSNFKAIKNSTFGSEASGFNLHAFVVLVSKVNLQKVDFRSTGKVPILVFTWSIFVKCEILPCIIKFVFPKELEGH